MSATGVFFHAHPYDEALATGGTMLLASRAGHRVIVVCATDGALGETPGLDAPEGPQGLDLAAVREAELRDSAGVLGVHEVVMLGYRDSGMAGEAGNEHPDCFWQADLDEAAGRLAAILRDERADLLTVYDADGTYGRPDHIMVRRVGVRAAELAGVGVVYEAAIDRDHFRAAMKEMVQAAAADGLDAASQNEIAEFEAEVDRGTIGVDGSRITHRIDVRAGLSEKRAAMRAHASQIPAESFLMSLPHEAFERAFGTEWFIRRDPPANGRQGTDLFATLEPPAGDTRRA